MRLKTFEGSYDFRHSSYQQSNQLLHTDIIIETFNLYTLSQKMKQIELYIMINSQHFDKTYLEAHSSLLVGSHLLCLSHYYNLNLCPSGIWVILFQAFF